MPADRSRALGMSGSILWEYPWESAGSIQEGGKRPHGGRNLKAVNPGS